MLPTVTVRDPDNTELKKYRLKFSKARKSWVVKKLYHPTSNNVLANVVSPFPGKKKSLLWEFTRQFSKQHCTNCKA